jgi:uncharacterized protein (TIGR02646 family)
MRYINISDSPPKDWLEEAERLTEQLKKATSAKKRQKIITENEKHWRKDVFRDWLIDQFHRKCWYSEAKESVSSYHVDHFRPKGRVTELDGSNRTGYWWLAFDWRNYRISGELLNVKKRDQFPLRDGHAAEPFDENSLKLEASMLLDPRTEGDASLLSFNEGGEASKAEGIDEEDKLRVEITIDILGLNKRRCLVENRADKWVECSIQIHRYQNAAGPLPLKKLERALAVIRLKELVKYEEEFSSVALACVGKTAPEALYKQVIG